ncbi:MAG TPA: hypothetical protein VM677_20340 [Actinokineospora sp.]|nr:hypothetical protein [Actinokineospora sp.]
MNVGIYGPALPDIGFPSTFRYENTVGVNISVFGDGGGNAGNTVTESASTVLYRDGVKIGETEGAGYGVFDVPAERGRYRLTTDVDKSNSAPAGRAFVVPVSMQLEDGSVVVPRGLSVDVSYDEGKTWRGANVAGSVVLLFHPAGAKSVSLRAKAADGRGGTVEQTIVRAFKLK